MRRSEICGLRSESVELDRAVITVYWKVVSVHNVLFEGDPKSESSIREITIDDHTVQVLRDWRQVKAKDRRAATEAWMETGYEFTDEIGRGIHPTRLSTDFTKALKSSGLRHTTPHGAVAPARHPPARRRRPGQSCQRPPRPRLDRVHPGPLHQGHRTR
jgi:integrase